MYLFAGSGLFEPRRGPGHYAGATSGFSIPIGSTGVRYRIGQSRGTFIQGDESPTVIDTGTVVITDQRVVFLGTQRTVEWAFPKLVAIQHYQNRPWTAIQVSNRRKVTGVTYDQEHEHNFRLRLEAAVALFSRNTDELLGQVTEAIHAHAAERPHSAQTGAIPAGRVETGGPVGCKFAIRAVTSHDVRRPRRLDETLCATPTPPPRATPSANGGPHGIVYATQLGLDCPLSLHCRGRETGDTSWVVVGAVRRAAPVSAAPGAA